MKTETPNWYQGAGKSHHGKPNWHKNDKNTELLMIPAKMIGHHYLTWPPNFGKTLSCLQLWLRRLKIIQVVGKRTDLSWFDWLRHNSMEVLKETRVASGVCVRKINIFSRCLHRKLLVYIFTVYFREWIWAQSWRNRGTWPPHFSRQSAGDCLRPSLPAATVSRWRYIDDRRWPAADVSHQCHRRQR